MDSRVLAVSKVIMDLSDAQFSESICINSIPLNANVSELKREETLEQGGFVASYGLRIVINKKQSITPQIGQEVNYNLKKYRILTVESDFISYTITCDSVDK